MAKRIKIPICKWDEESATWKVINVPTHAAAKQVENEAAVYPVEGVCPTDPPVEIEDGVVPEASTNI